MKKKLFKEDGLVKSLKRLLSVIPAQAGIQYFHAVRILWIPIFTGMTTFYESIKEAKPKIKKVRFNLFAPEAERVSRAGDFNNWMSITSR